LGNYRAAIEHLKKVLSMSAEHRFEMLNNMGIFYAEMGDYESAIRHFEEALQLNPDHERLKFNLELARQRQSQ
jgi:tetratricopeptide (TPR) repeat protein